MLSAHPRLELVLAAAGRSAGGLVQDSWPALAGLPVAQLALEAANAQVLAERCDVVFLALPHGVSARLAAELVPAGVKVVDLGADFRLDGPEQWLASYGSEHQAPQLFDAAVYGMPERRPALSGAQLIAAPGCYPTSVTLAAMPLVEQGLADFIVADCVSGVSGAGRKAGSRNLYCAVNESVVAYGVGGTHRHSDEMERNLGVPVSFTPHLVPMQRGILATVHARVADPPSTEELGALYRERYAQHPLVVVRDQAPATGDVRGTCRAHVYPVSDPRRGVISVFCAIDNLIKGAGGQALQAFNLSMGWPETMGLPLFPVLP